MPILPTKLSSLSTMLSTATPGTLPTTFLSLSLPLLSSLSSSSFKLTKPSVNFLGVSGPKITLSKGTSNDKLGDLSTFLLGAVEGEDMEGDGWWTLRVEAILWFCGGTGAGNAGGKGIAFLDLEAVEVFGGTKVRFPLLLYFVLRVLKLGRGRQALSLVGLLAVKGDALALVPILFIMFGHHSARSTRATS